MKRQPICEACGIYGCATIKVRKDGSRQYAKKCSGCRKKPYLTHKKEFCEMCGFVPVHPIQLDVDHLDGVHDNNRVENLQTLCANCHRLKTLLRGEHGPR